MYTEKISNIDFILDVNIKVKNINLAFEIYQSKSLEDNSNLDNSNLNKLEIYNIEMKYIEFIDKCFDLNNKKGIIVDFYMDRLDEEALEKMKSFLDINEIVILEAFLEENNYAGTYFKVLKKEILTLFIKLSVREIFFISFYMLDYEVTLWGNYNRKFPIFYKEEKLILLYENIANENNLLVK
ncbi:hypothetical protein [uncultured Clostridium sp.]|jgi:hypothetical protein|uniref:hypothetical protein n=1 Tax=uncultured Clostridium sp. TaxID=59620 RepID=UPI00262ED4B3|nr:hypothetical protein [uncultured Clostridium sp.]